MSEPNADARQEQKSALVFSCTRTSIRAWFPSTRRASGCRHRMTTFQEETRRPLWKNDGGEGGAQDWGTHW